MRHSSSRKSASEPRLRSGRYYGEFSGNPRLELLPDGRNAVVHRRLTFNDPNGIVWVAPKGSKVDGASIPRIMWSLIGGPWDGPYRNASIIHDVACVEQDREWQLVHRCFYNAMMAIDAMGSFKAKVMYAAVYHFGPKWKVTAPGPGSVRRPRMKKADLAFFEREIAAQEAVAELVGVRELSQRYREPASRQPMTTRKGSKLDDAVGAHRDMRVVRRRELSLSGIEALVPPSKAAAERRELEAALARLTRRTSHKAR
jgi:hypothetical protein